MRYVLVEVRRLVLQDPWSCLGRIPFWMNIVSPHCRVWVNTKTKHTKIVIVAEALEAIPVRLNAAMANIL